MKRRNFIKMSLGLVVGITGIFPIKDVIGNFFPENVSVKNAGFRCEQQGRISGYMDENPASYWVDVSRQMATKFGYQSTGIWILAMHSEQSGDRSCLLNFPSPGEDESFDNINFYNTDKNEDYLTAFDIAGVKIYLQCEPSDASVSDLIKLILDRYSHHQCIIGFGIDVEWYKFVDNPDGKPVTNTEALSWINQIKAYNPNYKLFIKHWDAKYLPTIHYHDVVYINDSQGHQCLSGCDDNIMDRYTTFANYFADALVGFQIGYGADKIWWSSYTDPAKKIGDAIIENIPNLEGIYWVDFTIKDIFP